MMMLIKAVHQPQTQAQAQIQENFIDSFKLMKKTKPLPSVKLRPENLGNSA